MASPITPSIGINAAQTVPNSAALAQSASLVVAQTGEVAKRVDTKAAQATTSPAVKLSLKTTSNKTRVDGAFAAELATQTKQKDPTRAGEDKKVSVEA